MPEPELHDAHVQRWQMYQLVDLWIREYGVDGARRLLALHMRDQIIPA